MKRFILILAVLLITLGISAQSFTFGPKIGFNASKLTTDYPELKEDDSFNFLFGAFVRIGKKIYVQPEIVYATKGGTFVSEVEQGAEMKISFKQMEVPLLVGWRMIDLKKANIRIMAGPVAGFVMDKTITASEFVEDPLPPDALKDIMWGMQLGAGIDLFLLTFDVRYEIGLNNLYLGQPADLQSYFIKNNLWHVSIGWTIL